MIKFKAKAIMPVEELNELGYKHENGWVIGSWVGEDLIIGDIIEAAEEYIIPSFWLKVEKSTIHQIDLMNTLGN